MFFWASYSSNNPEQLFSMLMIKGNVSWVPNQQDHVTLKTGIKTAENSDSVITRINYILKYIQIERYITKLRFYCIFDQINAALVRLENSLQTRTFLKVCVCIYVYIYIQVYTYKNYTGLHILLFHSPWRPFPLALVQGGGGRFLIPWFLKDHVTLKIGVMVAEKSAWSLQE